MPVFKTISKTLAKEVGDKEMKHVTCVNHATRVKLYSLFQEEKHRSGFWKKEYRPLSFSLLDILEPSSSLPETDVEGPLHFSETRRWGVKIDVAVDAVAEAKAEVEASQFQESSLQYQLVEILDPKLDVLRKRKLLDPEPPFLRKCRSDGLNLYVVTMIVELLNSSVLRDISSGSVSGGVSSIWNFIKVKAEGKGQTVRELMLSLKKGMVMAYKKRLLVFKDNDWDIIDDLDDTGKSFPEIVKYSSRSSEMQYERIGPIPPIGRIEEPSGQDFKCLEREINMTVKNVTSFERNFPGVMFVNIQAMLGDRQALEDLMDMLDQGKTSCHLNGPGATILNELARIPEYPYGAQVKLILYLLEAIMVLNDTQHTLLAWSMERRILFHQLILVRSILEPNFKYPWCIPFTLNPQLLALLQDEGVAITYGLLQECGLRMELNNPRSTWDLEAKKPLSALLASLTILHWLTQS